MIKKLRRRFVLIAMLSFFIVLTLLVAALNVFNFVQTEKDIDGMLHLLIDNRGVIPGGKDMPQRPAKDDKHREPDIHITPETPYKTRYFTVDIAPTGEIALCDTSHIAAIDQTQATQYALTAAQSSHGTGRIGGIYRYYRQARPDGGLTVVFLDCSDQLSMRNTLLISSVIIEFISLAAVFLPVYLLSSKAIRPVADSIEKQKRFITDASHEIKTPLAIISANADVMSMTQENSEWLDSIKHQTLRLSKLVDRLVTLARLDEERPQVVMNDFSLSDAVYDAAYPFGALAEAAKKALTLDISPDILYHGDEGAIRQLVSLLTDNAVKYTDDGGKIHIALKRQSKGICLEVQNDCRDFDASSIPHLFDRFYRADDSRSRKSGGYGIGLSVARAICDAHGVKIYADYDKNNGKVIFAVQF